MRELPFADARHGVCALEEITEAGQGSGFGTGHEAFRVMLLRTGAGVVAYHNCCRIFPAAQL